MARRARIYEQPKSSMQSGRAGTDEWIVDFEQATPRRAEPLMGWISSDDTQTQLRLRFPSREAAVDYAERNGLLYQVELSRPRTFKPKAYADNFRYGRIENWTH